MSPISNNFWKLLKEKEARERRVIPLTEVAQATGVTRKTLIAWRDNKLTRVNEKTAKALCHYFGCRLQDLIELV